MGRFKVKLVAYFGLLCLLPLVATVDAADARLQSAVLVALALSLALVALVAFLEGRKVARRIAELVSAADAIAGGRFDERVPAGGRDELALLGRAFNSMASQLAARVRELDAQRDRLRDSFARFGEALSATHDPDQLLRVVVEAAVEATGGSGGVLVGRSGELVQIGTPGAGDDVLQLPIRAGRLDFGTLTLFSPRFTPEDSMMAASLVAHAVVALDNARLHRVVERQALIDGLTGLANRRHAEETIAAEVARAERFGSPLSVLLADLDDFKRVNDRHGHPTGDGVLREFAAVIREGTREFDLAARWGGEEFLVVLPGTDAEGAAFVAERLRQTLAARTILAPDGTPLRVTASFGVASWPDAATGEELVSAADAALYSAKRLGKNRVVAAPQNVAAVEPS